MTRSVERRHFYAIANFEGLLVSWRFGHLRAVFATNDWDRVSFKLEKQVSYNKQVRMIVEC